jgi:hypothetical protein
MNPFQNDTQTPPAQGKATFHAKTTMLEALTADPSLGMVLMRDFHLGGCRNCGFDPQNTIEEVAAQNGIPTERLLAALNRQA